MPKARARTDPALVVGYTRCSTGEQAASGAGIAAQRHAIQTECERRGWTLLTVFEDSAASGGSMAGRRALVEALAAVETGIAGTIMVSRLDRLTRSLMDFAGLMERARRQRWNLVALDLGLDLSTPAGELTATLMAAVAVWERSVIGQRTRDALAARRASGVRLGRPVRVGGDVAARIASRRAGGATLMAIANELTRDGVSTPSGTGAWRPSVIAGIARRAGVASHPRGRRPRVAA
jgi:DNA invertase Pin-like site-specific DNA recombinase